jgi:hypothetical protein
LKTNRCLAVLVVFVICSLGIAQNVRPASGVLSIELRDGQGEYIAGLLLSSSPNSDILGVVSLKKRPGQASNAPVRYDTVFRRRSVAFGPWKTAAKARMGRQASEEEAEILFESVEALIRNAAKQVQKGEGPSRLILYTQSQKVEFPEGQDAAIASVFGTDHLDGSVLYAEIESLFRE